jgi:hypothetical protein
MKTLRQIPEFGAGVYQITAGPAAHVHRYHKYCPFSTDETKLLFLEYELDDPEARVCLMDVSTGAIEVAGTSTAWGTHSAANQFWVDGRIIYCERETESGGHVFALVSPDGTRTRVEAELEQIGAVVGTTGYGTAPFSVAFPNDAIGDRSRVGLLAADLSSGDTHVLCSLERVVESHPDADRIRDYHIMLKQVDLHPNGDLILFVATNMPPKNAGLDAAAPAVKYLYAYRLSTDELVHLGPVGHHPIWHTKQPWGLTYSPDDDGVRRLTLDKLGGDGSVTREYLGYRSHTGHPSVSPDGRRILTDTYSKYENRVAIDLYDPEHDATVELASYPEGTDPLAYPHTQAERESGESMAEYTRRITTGSNRKIVVQAHPAWDRTGRRVVFNADSSGLSQLYMIDLDEALEA